jgi:hypothetical protein
MALQKGCGNESDIVVQFAVASVAQTPQAMKEILASGVK